MPVATGVVRDLRMAARRVLAARDMPAERRRAAALDRTHDLQLIEAHMAAIGLAPSGTVVAEDTRHSGDRFLSSEKVPQDNGQTEHRGCSCVSVVTLRGN